MNAEKNDSLIIVSQYFLGEAQQAYFPGLQRGLVAVLLYYDGHVSLVNALRMLIQAREGRVWTLGLSSDVTQLVTKFTDQLVQEGLVNKILSKYDRDH